MSTSGTSARDQVARLLALVPYLQNRADVPIAKVAADFGVPPQRIRKDLEVLWYCGLPGLGMGDLIEIDMDAIEEGVVHLSNADYLSRPLKLDRIEAAALLVALRTLREGSKDDERALVDQVLAKIEAAAGDAQSAAQSVDVRVPTDLNVATARDLLDQAIRGGARVRLRYYVPSRDEETERIVDPLALGGADGRLYLDAWCHQAQDQRLFRLDRIAEVTVLSERAEAHPDVAPRDLTESLFQPASDDLLVELALQPAARWVVDYYPVESVEPQADGTIAVSLRTGDVAWLTRLVLRLRGQAEVVSPQEVRAEVTTAAQRALSLYT